MIKSRWIARVVVVDGIETELLCEADTYAEALADLLAGAEDMGAAPPDRSMIPVKPTKRGTRTKLQKAVDAVRDDARKEPEAPALPIEILDQQGVTVWEDPPVIDREMEVSIGATASAILPDGVVVSPPPYMMPEPPAPPAPIMSDDEIARADLNAAINTLIKSVPETWAAGIKQNLDGLLNPFGNLQVMSADRAKAAVLLVDNYRKTCEAHLRAQGK